MKSTKKTLLVVLAWTLAFVFCATAFAKPGENSGKGQSTGQWEAKVHLKDDAKDEFADTPNNSDVTVTVGNADKEYKGTYKGSQINIDLESKDNILKPGDEITVKDSNGKTTVLVIGEQEGNGGGNGGNDQDKGLNNYSGKKKPTPTPEQPSPTPEQPTPTPEQPTPTPEQPTPTPEQPTPTPEQPTPTPEQRDRDTEDDDQIPLGPVVEVEQSSQSDIPLGAPRTGGNTMAWFAGTFFLLACVLTVWVWGSKKQER